MAKITIEELYRGDRYDIMISVTGNAMHVSLGDLNDICELRSRRNLCVCHSVELMKNLLKLNNDDSRQSREVLLLATTVNWGWTLKARVSRRLHQSQNRSLAFCFGFFV